MKGYNLKQPVRLMLTLEAEHRERLRDLAHEGRCTVADLIRDAVEAFLESREPVAPAPPLSSFEPLTDVQRSLLTYLQDGPLAMHQLYNRGIAMSDVMVSLLELEIKGAVKLLGGLYVAVARI